MNRRSFLSALLKAGVAAAVLPAATTYARRWVKERGLILPDYSANARIDPSWKCFMQTPMPVVTLHSFEWTAYVDTPPWIENFSTP